MMQITKILSRNKKLGQNEVKVLRACTFFYFFGSFSLLSVRKKRFLFPRMYPGMFLSLIDRLSINDGRMTGYTHSHFFELSQILLEEPEKVTRLFLFHRRPARKEDVSRTSSLFFNFKTAWLGRISEFSCFFLV